MAELFNDVFYEYVQYSVLEALLVLISLPYPHSFRWYPYAVSVNSLIFQLPCRQTSPERAPMFTSSVYCHGYSGTPQIAYIKSQQLVDIDVYSITEFAWPLQLCLRTILYNASCRKYTAREPSISCYTTQDSIKVSVLVSLSVRHG